MNILIDNYLRSIKYKVSRFRMYYVFNFMYQRVMILFFLLFFGVLLILSIRYTFFF